VFNKQLPGFAIIILVVSIAAFLGVIALVSNRINIRKVDQALVINNYYQALATAQNCSEEAMYQLARSSTYVGGVTLTINQYTCTIGAVTTLPNNNKQFDVSAQVGTVTKAIRFEVNPPQIVKVTPL